MRELRREFLEKILSVYQRELSSFFSYLLCDLSGSVVSFMQCLTRYTVISIFILISLLFSGCGYHFGHGQLSEEYETVSIPYVEGDIDGDLTARIIKRLSTSGAFQYLPCGGDLIVKINLLEIYDENIGFRYNRHKDGRLKNTTIPTETRMKGIVEVVVIEAASGKIIRGPTRMMAGVDFDHDYYASRHEINVFSLGQLTDIDAAQDAARSPLNERLADKIVDYLIVSW